MAIIITRVPDSEDVWGRTKVTFKDITLDTSYPATTGYVINASDVGLKYLLGGVVVGGNQASGKLLFILDFNAGAGELTTAVRLRAFFPTGGAGTAPTTLANPTITAGGTGQAPIIPGVAKEVADTADLSTIILRVSFRGR